MTGIIPTKSVFAVAACLAGMMVTQAPTAQAVPFQLQFQSELTILTDTTVLDVGAGDIITFNIIVDNGGATLEDQSWNQADVLSAEATVEGYEAVFAFPFGLSDPIFETTGTSVSLAAWLDFDTGNSDNLGPGSPRALTNFLFPSNDDTFAFADQLSDENVWTIEAAPVTAVPLPGALSFLAAALLGLGYLGVMGHRNRSRVPGWPRSTA